MARLREGRGVQGCTSSWCAAIAKGLGKWAWVRETQPNDFLTFPAGIPVDFLEKLGEKAANDRGALVVERERVAQVPSLASGDQADIGTARTSITLHSR